MLAYVLHSPGEAIYPTRQVVHLVSMAVNHYSMKLQHITISCNVCTEPRSLKTSQLQGSFKWFNFEPFIP